MNWLLFVVLAGVGQGFFLALLLFRMKSGIRKANRFLSGFVAAVSFSIGVSILSRLSVDAVPGLAVVYRIHEPLQFLFGPLMLLFVRALLGQDTDSVRVNIPHFIPAVLYILFLMAGYVPLSRLQAVIPDPDGNAFHVLFEIVTSLHVWIYLLAGVLLARKVRNNAAGSVPVRANAGFALNFQFGTALVYLAFLVILIVLVIKGYDYNLFMAAVGLTGALSLYSMSYFFLINAGSIGRPDAAKYRNSPLGPAEKERLWSDLKTVLAGERLYLDPELNQVSLSRRLGIPRQYLSQIVGEKTDGTFNDLVNGYRLDAFVDRIDRGYHKKYNLLALALDSGFNSKTAFLSAFRKKYGVIPSEYIKNR